MKPTHLASAILLALPLGALAADPPPPPQGWSGSGEAGLAVASGNTKSENVNAKVDLKFNDDRWKDDFYVLALRNKANVTTTTLDTSTTPPSTISNTNYRTTADRWEGGASVGYKVDERSYIVGALRYEHDEFAPYDYQYIASLGYGYQVLKNPHDELSFEVGAGYKVVQPTAFYVSNPNPPPDLIKLKPDSDSNPAGRGKIDYKHSFNANTSIVNSFLVESASGNTFIQNDLGLAVKMTNALALKATYEVRHNSEVADGFKKTDQLLTTNLVYSF
jgi:putative salt-induced outer membrane protein